MGEALRWWPVSEPRRAPVGRDAVGGGERSKTGLCLLLGFWVFLVSWEESRMLRRLKTVERFLEVSG